MKPNFHRCKLRLRTLDNNFPVECLKANCNSGEACFVMMNTTKLRLKSRSVPPTDTMLHVWCQAMIRRAMAHEGPGSVFAAAESTIFEIVATFVNICKKQWTSDKATLTRLAPTSYRCKIVRRRSNSLQDSSTWTSRPCSGKFPRRTQWYPTGTRFYLKKNSNENFIDDLPLKTFECS